MFDWLIGTTSQIVGILKKVVVEILKWIWNKIKEWAIANWQVVVIIILVLLVVGLVKLLLLKLQLTPILKDIGILSA